MGEPFVVAHIPYVAYAETSIVGLPLNSEDEMIQDGLSN